MPRHPRIYWDANIFIALVKGEVRPNREMDGVYECAAEFDRGKVILFTTELIDLEVSRVKMELAQRSRYDLFFARRNMQKVAFNPRVRDLKKEIVDYYAEEARQSGKLPVTEFDAIHLASAIFAVVDEMNTFDEGKKGGRSLLSLSGLIADKYPLVIRKPVVPQTGWLPGLQGEL